MVKSPSGAGTDETAERHQRADARRNREQILDAAEVPDLATLQQRFMLDSTSVPEVTVTIPAAIAYDSLLGTPREWRS